VEKRVYNIKKLYEFHFVFFVSVFFHEKTFFSELNTCISNMHCHILVVGLK